MSRWGVVDRTQPGVTLKLAAVPPDRARFEQRLISSRNAAGIGSGVIPPAGRTAAAASRGSEMRKGPCSVPRNPAVWKAFRPSLSAPISRFWPMSMNAGYVSVVRPQCTGDPRADVRRCHGERRSIPSVPMILVSRVEDEAKVSGLVTADQCRPIHYRGDSFETARELDVCRLAVSMLGNVLRTRLDSSPGSNGV